MLFAITFHVYTKAAPCVYAMEVMLGENIHVQVALSVQEGSQCVCVCHRRMPIISCHTLCSDYILQSISIKVTSDSINLSWNVDKYVHDQF